MVHTVVHLLTDATLVAVVGLAAVGLLFVDLARRELGETRLLAWHYRAYGLAASALFLALAALRFLSRAG